MIGDMLQGLIEIYRFLTPDYFDDYDDDDDFDDEDFNDDFDDDFEEEEAAAAEA